MNLTEQGLHYLRDFRTIVPKLKVDLPFLMLTMHGPEELVGAGLERVRFAGTHNPRYFIGPTPFRDYGTFWGAIVLGSYQSEVSRGGWVDYLCEELEERPPKELNWAISLWFNTETQPICIDPVLRHKR